MFRQVFMIMDILHMALVGGGILLVLSGGAFLWSVRKRIAFYRVALDASQKKLDIHISRVNMLARVLPQLQSLVSDAFPSDSWKVLVLDEARAILRADGASYWRFLEREQALEFDVMRGMDEKNSQKEERVKLNESPLQEAIFHRRGALLSTNKESASAFRGGALVVPLIVTGNIWGVFHFLYQNDSELTQRDVDLADMLMKQLGLALENRDMTHNREKFYLELVQTLADIMDSRDAANEGQTRRVRSLARSMAKTLDMPEEFIYYLEFAALLHDIGKLAIDDQLLKKPGKLTLEEFERVKKHPEVGCKILQRVSLLAPAAPMVLYHKERFDGTGYPEGLRGEEIPLGARIVAVLSAWGAMTSVRAWRPALSQEQAMAEIKNGSGTQFDPRVVEAFLATLEQQGLAVNAESNGNASQRNAA